MAEPADRIEDVREGHIKMLDFENQRGLIEVTNPENGVPLSSISFDLSELRVAREDLSYLEKNTKVMFKVRPDRHWECVAYAVTPIDNDFCYAQIYGVAKDYVRVLIWKSKTLANVNLESLKRLVPHQYLLTHTEHCIVALPWMETSKADREKRFPVVELLELHDSKDEAEAALVHIHLRRSGIAETIATELRWKESAGSRTPASESRSSESGSPPSSGDHILGREDNARECILTPAAAPTRDQLQMAYWSGVRDGALRYQQFSAPYYAVSDHFLNEPPIKHNVARQIYRRY